MYNVAVMFRIREMERVEWTEVGTGTITIPIPIPAAFE